MKINRNNYEAYFVDYLEGNLDEKLVDNFLEFLQQNPDLKEELALFQSVSLEPEEIKFNKKETLYKSKFDLEDNFNHFSIALLEGDLTRDEEVEYENYLNSHPEKRTELQLFEKTKLQPDLSVKFNKKSNLFHRSTGRSIIMWSVRIAAVFILALTFFTLTEQYSKNKQVEPHVASNKLETTQNENSKKDLPEQPVLKPDDTVQKPEVIAETKTTEPRIEKPESKGIRTIHENSSERMNETDVNIERITVEPIMPIKGITAALEVQPPRESLRPMQYAIAEDPVYQEEERFLADVVVEKTGIDKLSFNKIAKAGLNIVSNISKEKLTYETNESGKVTEISYDSRLFAFSIPTNGETNK